ETGGILWSFQCITRNRSQLRRFSALAQRFVLAPEGSIDKPHSGENIRVSLLAQYRFVGMPRREQERSHFLDITLGTRGQRRPSSSKPHVITILALPLRQANAFGLDIITGVKRNSKAHPGKSVNGRYLFHRRSRPSNVALRECGFGFLVPKGTGVLWKCCYALVCLTLCLRIAPQHTISEGDIDEMRRFAWI